MKYIRPTLNLLTPAVSAIRGEGGSNDSGSCAQNGEKSLTGADGIQAGGCNLVHTSTTSAYEVDE
jgi:hypothetical protein